MAQTKSNETLINLLPVFHKGNLEFFSVQAAPEPLEVETRRPIRVAGGFKVSFIFVQLPYRNVRLVFQHRSVQGP